MDKSALLRPAFRVAGVVVPWLPTSVAYGAAHVGGLAAWRLNARGRAIVRDNLATLLDRRATSARLSPLVRGVYVNHAKNYADSFALRAMSREEVMRRTTVYGFERLMRVLDAGKGAVIATAHLGNVDFAGNALTGRGARCGVLVEHVEPPWLLDFFLGNRSKFTSYVIPYREGVLPHLLATVKTNVGLAVTCDWDMQGNGIRVQVAGKTMMMPAGLALIALRARAPVVPVFSVRQTDGRTAVYIEPPLDVPMTGKLRDDMATLSQATADVLTRYLLRYPEQWVLFHPAWPAPSRVHGRSERAVPLDVDGARVATGSVPGSGAGAPRPPS